MARRVVEGEISGTEQGPILDPFAHMHPALRSAVILVKPAPGEAPYPGICGLCCRVCRNLCFPFDRASSFWLIYSVVFNAPPAFAALVIAGMNLGSGACEKNLVLYLGLTVLLFNFGAIGCAARVYFVSLRTFNPLGVGQGRVGALKRSFVPNICQRAAHVCSDPLGALYGVWLLAALAWPLLGALWVVQSLDPGSGPAPPSCPRSLLLMVGVSAAALALYILSLLAILSCTCCCELTGWAASLANPGAATVTALRLHQALQGTAPASAGPGLEDPLLGDHAKQGGAFQDIPADAAMEAGVNPGVAPPLHGEEALEAKLASLPKA